MSSTTTLSLEQEVQLVKPLVAQLLASGCLRGKVLCLDASIAAGKTFLSNRIKEVLELCGFPDVMVFAEKIDKQALAKFNMDRRAMALPFQEIQMNLRIGTMQEAHTWAIDHNGLAICDTGALREFAFTEANIIDGGISWDAGEKHKQAFRHKMLEYEREILPHWNVWLDVPYNICYNNMLSRAAKRKKETPGEDSKEELLPKTYLQLLEEAHSKEFTNRLNIGYMAQNESFRLKLMPGYGFVTVKQVLQVLMQQQK